MWCVVCICGGQSLNAGCCTFRYAWINALKTLGHACTHKKAVKTCSSVCANSHSTHQKHGWYAAYGAIVWHNHLYGRFLRGERVNQPMVSHTANQKGPAGDRGVSRLPCLMPENPDSKQSEETELSTSWWLFVCFGSFIHNFAILLYNRVERSVNHLSSWSICWSFKNQTTPRNINCSLRCLRPVRVTLTKTTNCTGSSLFHETV